MGCWNESCGLTGLPVTDGLKCRYMIIRKVKRSKDDHAVYYPFDIFQPVSILVEGEYDDYGGVELETEVAAAFFESLTASRVEFAEATMHGNIRINGNEYTLPVDSYHWFARDDSFQMLNKLPLRDSRKTLGQSQKETLAKVVKVADETVRRSAIYGSFLGGYEISQAFGRMEMPQPPVFSYLNDRLMAAIAPLPKEEINRLLDDGEKPDLDAILAKLPPPDLSRVPEFAQPMLDLTRILYGMVILRKQLCPTGGAGSQSWNDTAYEVYGKFVADTATNWRREIEGEG